MASHDFVPQYVKSALSKKPAVVPSTPIVAPVETPPVATPHVATPAVRPTIDEFEALFSQVNDMQTSIEGLKAEIAALSASVAQSNTETAMGMATSTIFEPAVCDGYLEAAAADLVPYPPGMPPPPTESSDAVDEDVSVSGNEGELEAEEDEASSNGDSSDESDNAEQGDQGITLSNGNLIVSASDVTKDVLVTCRVADLHQLCDYFGIEVPPRSKKAIIRYAISESLQVI